MGFFSSLFKLVSSCALGEGVGGVCASTPGEVMQGLWW